MSYEIAFYEAIEIVIALIALALQGFAYYQDFVWNRWLDKFGLDTRAMCDAFFKRTMNKAPVIYGHGFYNDLGKGNVHIKTFRRNSTGETGFVITESVAVVLLLLHIIFSCRSKKLVLKAKYGAYIHGLIFICLVPCSLSLATTAYEIESSYISMSAYHPHCSNIVFCRETEDEADISDEVDESKQAEIKDALTADCICQFFWVKLIAALFGGIHAFFSLAIVFVAMNVMSKLSEGAVGSTQLAEEAEGFFKPRADRGSKSQFNSRSSVFLKSGISISRSALRNTANSSRRQSSSLFPAGDELSNDSVSIEDFALVRKLSPQSMYREYKFRKQRIAEMEREQNIAEDPRLTQPGWDYDVDAFYEKNLAAESAMSNPNYPKRVYRKPKVINLAEEHQKKDSNIAENKTPVPSAEVQPKPHIKRSKPKNKPVQVIPEEAQEKPE